MPVVLLAMGLLIVNMENFFQVSYRSKDKEINHNYKLCGIDNFYQHAITVSTKIITPSFVIFYTNIFQAVDPNLLGVA